MPISLIPPSKPIDNKSPLSEGLYISPWPPTYKPISLPKFNGSIDPHHFKMSSKAALASIGGNDTVLAKSVIIVAEGDALAWYSKLKPFADRANKMAKCMSKA
jgi:hypothetical protein